MIYEMRKIFQAFFASVKIVSPINVKNRESSVSTLIVADKCQKAYKVARHCQIGLLVVIESPIKEFTDCRQLASKVRKVPTSTFKYVVYVAN